MSSHVWKKGVQSMKRVRLARSYAREDARAEEGRRGRAIGAPVDRRGVGARFGERGARSFRFAPFMRRGDLAVFHAHRLDRRSARLGRQQRRHDADGPARVVDMDRLAAGITRMDLDRGVDAARRGAADEERDVEALALHLRRDMRHLVERGRDEAGQADRRRPSSRGRPARIFEAGVITPRSMIS